MNKNYSRSKTQTSDQKSLKLCQITINSFIKIINSKTEQSRSLIEPPTRNLRKTNDDSMAKKKKKEKKESSCTVEMENEKADYLEAHARDTSSPVLCSTVPASPSTPLTHACTRMPRSILLSSGSTGIPRARELLSFPLERRERKREKERGRQRQKLAKSYRNC